MISKPPLCSKKGKNTINLPKAPQMTSRATQTGPFALHLLRTDHELLPHSRLKILCPCLDFLLLLPYSFYLYAIMTHKEKLSALRAAMQQQNLDAYIIPSSDPHMSEYLPDHWRIIAWLTGFTGSAGTVVVTRDFAGVWTDSRYFIQAEEQLRGSGFSLVKLIIPHTPEWIAWLKENLPPGSRAGYDSNLMSMLLHRRLFNEFGNHNIHTVPDIDLISPLWQDRPPFPPAPAFEHPSDFAGKSVTEKLSVIRRKMKEFQADYTLLTALDDIAWTFNIRGKDILYNPVVLAWALVSLDEASLFIRLTKIPRKLKDKLLKQNIFIKDYDDFFREIAKIPESKTVYLSPSATNAHIYHMLSDVNHIIRDPSIPALLKSAKDKSESAHIRQAMIKDGIALTKFFYWLEHNIGKIRITELSAAEKLESFRAEQEHFTGPSFATISSFGSHGAIVHYTPSPESDMELTVPGIYLLDSGGQYFDGTTDITRTVMMGEPTRQQKKDFTLVLKGMIDLAMCRFPEGTKGYHLDILARNPLWSAELNYGHGTGHGVGYFLNVHESPPSVNPRCDNGPGAVLEPGMVLSDEPGLYREGEYGIRTENLLQVIRDRETPFGSFLRFETLTLCYIDQKLIEPSLLSEEEKEWLDHYHEEVYRKLSPRLDEELRKWLKKKTKKIMNDK